MYSASNQSNALRDFAIRNVSRLKKNASANVFNEKLVASRYNILVRITKGRCLLFNSATRSLCMLTSDEFKQYISFVSDSSNIKIGDPTVNIMRDAGFLVSKLVNELESLKQKYFISKFDTTSLSLTIAPTMSCNLACGYCFQGHDKDRRKIESGVPDAIIELIDKQKDNLKSLSVTYYGGEPLMAKSAIYELSDRMISLCGKENIEYAASIITNGYFLTVDVAQKLFTRRCSAAQITIDSNGDTHDKMRPLLSGKGSFDVIIENVNNVLKETPMRIECRVNVGRDNVDSCNDLLDEFKKRGFETSGQFGVYFAPIDAGTAESGTAFDERLSKQDFHRALVQLSERAYQLGLANIRTPPSGFMGMCVAAKDNAIVVTPNGDLHKCWETAHDSSKRVGTVYEPEKVSESLNTKVWQSWSPFDNDVCSSCKILPLCGGLCAHRFVYYGAGDDNALPCPDWKWNTAEYLFSRAKALGVVTQEDWLESESTVTAKQSGERHTPQSLSGSQKIVLEKINKSGFTQVDAKYLLTGDGYIFTDNTVSNELVRFKSF